MKIADNAYKELKIKIDKASFDVINNKEIREKWGRIKFEELKKIELKSQQAKEFIQNIDREINKVSQYINFNILYQLFLINKFDLKIVQYQPISVNCQVYSQLFSPEIINYDILYKPKLIEDKIEVEFVSKLNINWETKKLKKIYEQGYEKLFYLPFNYKFKIEGRYKFNEQNIVEEGLVYVKE